MENEGLGTGASRNQEILDALDLSTIFENTRDSVWAIDLNYGILYANKVFTSAFHVSFGVELSPGTNLLMALPEPMRDIWKSRYDRALNKENFSFIDTVSADGFNVYIEVFMNPLIIDGEIIGALFFGKDVTKRKTVDEAIKSSELLLKSSLESQKDTILFSIDKSYNYLYFNSAHASVMKFAYKEDIKVGMCILDVISSKVDKENAKNNYDRALSGESHTEIREYGEENIAYYESFFNPLINDKEEIIGMIGMARDISERRKNEIALEDREKELKESNSTKDKLFSIIAHDLRSPFNAILSLSDLLLEKLNDFSFTELEQYLGVINSSANNSLNLLDNLLNWAKSQTGNMSVSPVRISFSNLILEVIRHEKPISTAKKISLNYFTTEEVEVYADENMLRIVLRNLISNAIKYTEKGGEIRVNAASKGAYVEVCISDNGIGISETKLRELFQVSSSASTVGTANERGSGLGLVLCKEFVERLGGRIWMESELGKGSDVKFTLPVSV